MDFIRVVLALQEMTLPNLNPGVSVMSRSDCVSRCYASNTCYSMTFDVDNRMCHMLDTVHDVQDLNTPSPGHQYLVFQPDECLPGYIWIRTMNLCYKVHASAKPWLEAEAICNQDGGHLIKAETAEVNSFVNALAFQAGSWFWIGGTDEATEGTWLWTDGSGITSDFWRPSQPDGGGEDCLLVDSSGDPKTWHDVKCFLGHSFIYQINLSNHTC